jgi:hypothetical protein
MNGEPYLVSEVVHSLRLRLWMEHLGLMTADQIQVSITAVFFFFNFFFLKSPSRSLQKIPPHPSQDPIADKTYHDLWYAV